MPLYEYKCHSCGKTIEVIQKFSDEPLKTHEDCGGDLEKLISRSAFQLKGSGWYATDYAKGNGGGSAKSEDSKSGDHKSDSGKTESTGSESKPAENKSGESKSSENKSSGEKKTSESKPAPATSSSESKS
jgi:putative FmdB family regulatory protein